MASLISNAVGTSFPSTGVVNSTSKLSVVTITLSAAMAAGDVHVLMPLDPTDIVTSVNRLTLTAANVTIAPAALTLGFGLCQKSGSVLYANSTTAIATASASAIQTGNDHSLLNDQRQTVGEIMGANRSLLRTLGRAYLCATVGVAATAGHTAGHKYIYTVAILKSSNS